PAEGHQLNGLRDRVLQGDRRNTPHDVACFHGDILIQLGDRVLEDGHRVLAGSLGRRSAPGAIVAVCSMTVVLPNGVVQHSQAVPGTRPLSIGVNTDIRSRGTTGSGPPGDRGDAGWTRPLRTATL